MMRLALVFIFLIIEISMISASINNRYGFYDIHKDIGLPHIKKRNEVERILNEEPKSYYRVNGLTKGILQARMDPMQQIQSVIRNTANRWENTPTAVNPLSIAPAPLNPLNNIPGALNPWSNIQPTALNPWSNVPLAALNQWGNVLPAPLNPLVNTLAALNPLSNIPPATLNPWSGITSPSPMLNTFVPQTNLYGYAPYNIFQQTLMGRSLANSFVDLLAYKKMLNGLSYPYQSYPTSLFPTGVDPFLDAFEKKSKATTTSTTPKPKPK